VQATAEFLQSYRWDLMVTLTTRVPAGPELLGKRYHELVRRVESDEAGLGLGGLPLWRTKQGLRHALAWELQRREAWHLHALWAAPKARGIRPRWVQSQWDLLCRQKTVILEEEEDGVTWLVTPEQRRRGRRRHQLEGIADVSVIRSEAAVAAYCSKYVAKGGTVELFGLAPRG
jgi:hypothetical protein